ncbi:hypothetical protein FGL97_01285 [Pseudomonas putida]|nr:hypothetical protein [Pseudomonas putida]NVN66877.1 hypothetical protein [Pseudomonas putida]
MDLRSYISTLDTDAQAAFAGRCGISPNYLRVHVKYASKDPSVALIRALARESQGRVSIMEVLHHYRVIDPGLASVA